MGYRLVIAVLSLLLITSCAAFDSDTDAIEGFGDQDQAGMPSTGKDLGPLSGYYSGNMVLNSNTCESISDEVGVESRIGVDVIQDENALNATFDDSKDTLTDMLEGKSAVFADEVMGVMHVYYFDFADDTVTGNCEVIEADEAGDFGDPCAVYAVELKKGEKPTEEPAESINDDSEEEEEEALQ
ncbi:MAG: hypothetical protein HN337_06215 [Deltaproteobacteria bacterium]|nr:hypothetical protein [Deltaproteobacteria bacterium]